MSIFPKISLRPEVENYLKESFMNEEVVSALGEQAAERKFETLLKHLSHPPSFTTVRVNTNLTSVQHVKNLLLDELQKEEYKKTTVRSHCWSPLWQCSVKRSPCLCSRNCVSFQIGIGIRMTEPVYLSPSFDNVLPSYLFLQNLPSALVTHVLNPQPGEKILDLCAAPGGKTTHIAALMHDQGEVIALDKIFNKVEKIRQNALLLGLNSIRAFCFDGTKAVKLDMVEDTEGGPPFLPETFDRILLDAPCSGMGQRPNMACTWTLKEVTSYQPLQRRLFTVAVQLLKPGGVLVYSTCTITLAENEEQVAWALTMFPCLQLQPQEPQIGGEGMMGAGLSFEQLKQLQRFDPSAVPLQDTDIDSLRDARTEDMMWLANKDCIGFFIAKFVKCKST
ncbi:tRNA (cytosine(72)-C(5))-methyltransferase NSUN6 isoform X4 [Lemur catta]|uniref:tRNA (cytosine(72)-C(5))-methyltransferase NSUN6 isoform X4 n=1 Tax=Lemur catta TaxID=9447 RepID=UPI001E26C4FD|nr:tRNA (cytosine(72)-C(5))-methyltransferase NSUN6 isoform X4 [Lemur catta]